MEGKESKASLDNVKVLVYEEDEVLSLIHI